MSFEPLQSPGLMFAVRMMLSPCCASSKQRITTLIFYLRDGRVQFAMPDVGTEFADPHRHRLLVGGVQAQRRRRLQQPQRLLQRRQLVPAESLKPGPQSQSSRRYEAARRAQQGCFDAERTTEHSLAVSRAMQQQHGCE